MLRPVAETFVDLTYRGLALGRRIKLTRVRATNGYLEHPTPMPVGTALAIATDDGLVFDAVVEAIHEQVGGSDRAPGMRVKPVFATDQLAGWWAKHAEPEVATPAPAADEPKPVTVVRPRSATIPEPVVAAEATTLRGSIPTPDEPLTTTPPARGGSATTVMNAIDQDLLAQLSKEDGGVEALTRRTGEHEVVDDGMRTSVMDAVDPAALGLDVSMLSSESGPISAAEGEGEDDERSAAESGPIDAQGEKKPKAGGSKKRKKKR